MSWVFMINESSLILEADVTKWILYDSRSIAILVSSDLMHSEIKSFKVCGFPYYDNLLWIFIN